MQPNSLNNLAKSLQAGQFLPAYLFYGSEEYLITKSMELIKDTLSVRRELNVVSIASSNLSWSNIISHLRQQPLFGDHNFVVVNSEKEQNFKIGGRELTLLQRYMAHPVAHSTLVIGARHGVLAKNPISQSLSQAGGVFACKPLTLPALQAWVKAYLGRKNTTIEVAALDFLLENVEPNLTSISKELDKILLNSEPERALIKVEDVAEYIYRHNQVNLLQFRQAILVGNKQALFSLFYAYMDTSPFPAISLLAYLFTCFSHLLVAAYAQQHNVNAPYTSYTPYASTYSYSQLCNIIHLFRTYELRIKTAESEYAAKMYLRDLLGEVCINATKRA